MRFVKYMLKNMIVSTLFIYSLNIFLINMKFIIPLSYFSLGLSGLLGFPGTLIYVLLVLKYLG